MNTSSNAQVYTYLTAANRWQAEARPLVMETPLQIWVNGEHLVTLHRTPGDEIKLATGYLFYQGLINHPDDISAERLVCNQEQSSPLAADSLRLTIKEPKAGISALTASAIWSVIAPQVRKSRAGQFFLAAPLIVALPEKLHQLQQLYRTTAGAHAVALVNRAGRILHLEEDSGRTNALDKLVGYCLREQIEMSSLAALFSGRINLEMAVKISRAGFPLVLSISAPTAGAVGILKESGINYVGSLRPQSFTLFNGSI